MKKVWFVALIFFVPISAEENEQDAFMELSSQGTNYFLHDQLDLAAQAYKKALEINPQSAPTHFNVGLVLTAQNNSAQALRHFKKALAIMPSYVKAHLNSARLYQQQNQLSHALYHYKQATHYQPNACEAYLEASKLYHDLALYDQELDELSKAVTYCPDNMNTKSAIANRLLITGNTFFNCRQSEKALTAFRAGLKLSDRFAALHHNIAFTLAEQLGQHTQAIAEYEKALALKPQDQETHFCYALSLLALGNLPRGFEEYEARWRRPASANASVHYPFDHQLTARNMHNLAGKRVLLRVEQGLGDTLHFIRYAQLLHELGAFIIAEVQKPLVTLLSQSDYIDEIIPVGTKRPAFDFQIPMLNLPLAFGTTLETIPAPIPYLKARNELVSYWHNLLENDHTFKIGICWFGDAVHGQVKFMPLSYFVRLANLPGITLYSLQKGSGADQLTPDMPIMLFSKDFDESHGSFMDTAAVMKNLDLVITVDTSIAHLAGGLGVPVWVVLPFPAEWRWLMNRADSPWYPTMRLFRQHGPENWDNVYAEIVEALVPLIEG